MKTIYLLLIILLATACDSDDAPSQESLLPPITMTGENTFGCLIDGKFFKPRDQVLLTVIIRDYVFWELNRIILKLL